MRIIILSTMIVVALILGPASIDAFRTTPEDGEKSFPVNRKIIIEFDNSMDISSVDWDVTPDPLYPFVPEWKNDDRTLIFTPSINLLEDKTYTIRITGDPENTTYASVDETFTFRTGIPSNQDGNGGLSAFSILNIVIIITFIVTIIAVFIFLKKM